MLLGEATKEMLLKEFKSSISKLRADKQPILTDK